VSFEGPGMKGQTVAVDAAYVHEKLDKVTQTEDLSKFIL
jgi:ATP-dependent protease HslVU (ClpYQ) ATPase subunit